MRIFKFDKDSGRKVTNFDSKHSTFSRIIQHNKPIHIGCFHIELKEL